MLRVTKVLRRFVKFILRLRSPKLHEAYPIPEFKRESQDLSVLSYNILLSGLDEENHYWVARKRAVIELILGLGPDLIGLQEVSGEQLYELENSLPAYQFIAINTVTGLPLQRENSSIEEGLAILYKKDKFRELNRTHWWHSDTPEKSSRTWGKWTGSFNKMTQKVLLKHLPTGAQVSFYNNHFHHDPSGNSDFNPRVESAKLELKEIQSDLDLGIIPISVGDRNFHFPRDQKAYDLYVNSAHLSDAGRKNQYGSNTTFVGYERHQEINPIDEEGHFARGDVLDFIFYSSSHLTVLQTQVLTGEYDRNGDLLPPSLVRAPRDRRFASDHSAIFTSFQFLK